MIATPHLTLNILSLTEANNKFLEAGDSYKVRSRQRKILKHCKNCRTFRVIEP